MKPLLTPPPARTTLKTLGQWSRPASLLIFGVRPNSLEIPQSDRSDRQEAAAADRFMEASRHLEVSLSFRLSGRTQSRGHRPHRWPRHDFLLDVHDARSIPVYQNQSIKLGAKREGPRERPTTPGRMDRFKLLLQKKLGRPEKA